MREETDLEIEQRIIIDDMTEEITSILKQLKEVVKSEVFIM